LLLREISLAIREGGMAWVDKAIRPHTDDGARFDRMLAEGWDE
jgi:hypothetical protein